MVLCHWCAPSQSPVANAGPSGNGEQPVRRPAPKPAKLKTSGDGKTPKKGGRPDSAAGPTLQKSKSQPAELTSGKPTGKAPSSSALKRLMLGSGQAEAPKRKLLKANTLPAAAKLPNPGGKSAQGNDTVAKARRASVTLDSAKPRKAERTTVKKEGAVYTPPVRC